MAARTALLSGTVLWSNGSPYDGYVLIGLVLPSGYSWASPVGSTTHVPNFTRVPVVAGAFSTSVRVYFNADLEPPNCRYVAYWYDTQDTRIAGPSAVFDITADPYAITQPSLVAPAAGTPATITPTYVDETPTGSIDGSNVTFTLSYTPSLLLFLWNGIVQAPGDTFTRSGSIITMTTAPTSGDLLRAVYWT